MYVLRLFLFYHHRSKLLRREKSLGNILLQCININEKQKDPSVLDAGTKLKKESSLCQIQQQPLYTGREEGQINNRINLVKVNSYPYYQIVI